MTGSKDMLCVSCWKRKQYPDGFPNRAFARCWECAWNEHIRDQHPKVIRQIERAAKKRARKITRREVEIAMFSKERLQVLGPGVDVAPIADEEAPT